MAPVRPPRRERERGGAATPASDRRERGGPATPASDRRERGQLILIGGLMLAVTLVSLTLILNSGIYTHNLATRSGSVADEGLAIRGGIEDGVGGLVEFAVDEHPDNVTRQETNVTDGLPAVREQVGRAAARDSTYAKVTYVGKTDGTQIVQEADRNFTNVSHAADWELVDGAGGIRQFRLDVTRVDLVSTSFGSVEGSDAFRVRLADANGNEWLLFVYEDSGATEVATQNVVSGTKHGPCTDASGTRTDIDVTAGTVAGDRCPALELFDRLPDDLDPAAGLTVQYNSTAVGGSPTAFGTYELTVDASKMTVDDGDYQSDPPGAFPRAREAIYSVEVEYVYETPDLTYETAITVVPGEPHD